MGRTVAIGFWSLRHITREKRLTWRIAVLLAKRIEKVRIHRYGFAFEGKRVLIG